MRDICKNCLYFVRHIQSQLLTEYDVMPGVKYASSIKQTELGVCTRYPQEIKKTETQSCGEFKDND